MRILFALLLGTAVAGAQVVNPGTNATQVNGASVPASQSCLGSNGSSQLVAGTCSGGTTANAVTFAASGGAAAGATFNGSAAVTVSFLTVGAAALASANTLTAANTFSYNGTASTPAVNITGTPYAGTNANSFGSLNIAWGTTPGTTALNTAGTAFTIQAPTGYTGDIANWMIGGTSKFTVDQYGDMIIPSSVIAGRVQSGVFVNSGGLFTASGCSVSSISGGGSAGKFTLGANACSVVITMSTSSFTGFACFKNDQTTAAGNTGMYFSATTTTTTTLVVPATAASGDVIAFGCIGY